MLSRRKQTNRDSNGVRHSRKLVRLQHDWPFFPLAQIAFPSGIWPVPNRFPEIMVRRGEKESSGHPETCVLVVVLLPVGTHVPSDVCAGGSIPP
jgi:hypothetical protein